MREWNVLNPTENDMIGPDGLHHSERGYACLAAALGEAIVAATRDSAEVAKVNSGMVAAGRSADFIVLDANPLDDITNTRKISSVYLRGAAVDRSQPAR